MLDSSWGDVETALFGQATSGQETGPAYELTTFVPHLRKIFGSIWRRRFSILALPFAAFVLCPRAQSGRDQPEWGKKKPVFV